MFLRKMLVGILCFFSLICITRSSYSKTIFDDFLKEKGVDLNITATLDFYNKYVWRGMLLDGDPVLQPGVAITANGFEGGFWSSFDLENNDSFQSDEVDGYLGYGHDLGFINEKLSKIKITAGHTWYNFPETDLYAKESYLKLNFDTLLAPYIAWYHDYSKQDSGGAKGDYYVLGVGHNIVLNEEYGITLGLSNELGFNNDYFITGDGGYDLTTIGLTIPIKGSLTVTPKIAYSVPFGDLADEDGGNVQKEHFYGGVSIAMSF